ncbi:MAG: hypothetical protein ACTSU5_10795 [Promethearchaeota archaeon]
MAESDEEFYTGIIDAYERVGDGSQFDSWRGKFYVGLMRELERHGRSFERKATNAMLVLEALGRDQVQRGVEIADLPPEERVEVLEDLRAVFT